ncbi:MAG: hypothetical protein HKN73_13230 [Gemmatimonadetes bacterium]|nr:hypothetical protein [Gemmatimonadota bacterium]
MRLRSNPAVWAVVLSGTAFATLAAVPAPAHFATGLGQSQVSFANDVLPIFNNRCVDCHGGTDENGEQRLESLLDLRSYEGVMAGSEFGTVIEAGDAEASYLLEMIVEGDMPEEGDPVPEAEIETIRSWITAGAENN